MTTKDKIVAFIGDFHSRRGYYPSVREISAGVGLASPGSTHGHLCDLVDDGRLRRLKTSTRRVAFALPETTHQHEWDTETDEAATYCAAPEFDTPWIIHECLDRSCGAIKVTRSLLGDPYTVVLIPEQGDHRGARG